MMTAPKPVMTAQPRARIRERHSRSTTTTLPIEYRYSDMHETRHDDRSARRSRS